MSKKERSCSLKANSKEGTPTTTTEDHQFGPTNGKNCGFCGKNNHTEDECYLKKKTKAMMIEEFDEEGDVSTDEANLVFCF